MTARENWTDERLDDLAVRMDKDFDRVHADIRELRSEMNTRFDAFEARFEKRSDAFEARFEKRSDAFEARLDALNARFDATQRTIVAGCLSIAAAIIAAGIF